MADELATRVLNCIRQHQLCQPGDGLILGVSGGADSVAMLDLLANLPGFPLELKVAHLNHCLRSTESDGDEEFVKQLAQQYLLPCFTKRVDVNSLALQKQLSLEDAARLARYSFFEELRQQHNAKAIAVAHNSDDQAETFLIRMLRGSGMDGLASIPLKNNFNIIRPLLGISRKEIEQYLAEKKLQYRTDSTNAETIFLRNRIRLQLLPLLEEYNPAIKKQLGITTELLQEDLALLDRYVQEDFQQLSISGPGWAALDKEGLFEKSRALRYRLYRLALKQTQGHLKRLEQQHCLLLDRLVLHGKTGTELHLPDNITARITTDQLLLAERRLLNHASPEPCTINGPGSYPLGNGLVLTVEETDPPADWSRVPDTTAYINPELAPLPWLVRPAQSGDRLTMADTTGSISIKKLLINLKIPRHLRSCLPLVCCNNQPVWLAGIRRSATALVQHSTEKAIRITLSGQEQLPLFSSGCKQDRTKHL